MTAAHCHFAHTVAIVICMATPPLHICHGILVRLCPAPSNRVGASHALPHAIVLEGIKLRKGLNDVMAVRLKIDSDTILSDLYLDLGLGLEFVLGMVPEAKYSPILLSSHPKLSSNATRLVKG